MYTLKTKMTLLWTLALASLLALARGQAGSSVSISYPNDVPKDFSTVLDQLLALNSDDNCCPSPEPNTCPFTMEPLQYYISYKPNKLCKVLPCLDTPVQFANCTCDQCNMVQQGQSVPGACMPSGHTDYWVRVHCFGFKGTKLPSMWTEYHPTWELISVPTSCRCD